jgi:hypothetical protein
VLYGGTAVALQLRHRASVDFDFFRFEPLQKTDIEASFSFMDEAQVIQEQENTIVAVAHMPAGTVKISFFGGIAIGRVHAPLQTSDSVLLVASLDDLLATKLNAILDRADAKDYRDIAAMLTAGVSLGTGLGAFAKMYGRDPALPLKAIGYFEDGDLPSLSKADRAVLHAARDRVGITPKVTITRGTLAVPLRQCEP